MKSGTKKKLIAHVPEVRCRVLIRAASAKFVQQSGGPGSWRIEPRETNIKILQRPRDFFGGNGSDNDLIAMDRATERNVSHRDGAEFQEAKYGHCNQQVYFPSTMSVALLCPQVLSTLRKRGPTLPAVRKINVVNTKNCTRSPLRTQNVAMNDWMTKDRHPCALQNRVEEGAGRLQTVAAHTLSFFRGAAPSSLW